MKRRKGGSEDIGKKRANIEFLKEVNRNDCRLRKIQYSPLLLLRLGGGCGGADQNDLRQGEFAASCIRIMPDVHAGKGCTIGTTMTLTDRVVPAMVGVYIGCGILTVKLNARELDFAQMIICRCGSETGGVQFMEK